MIKIDNALNISINIYSKHECGHWLREANTVGNTAYFDKFVKIYDFRVSLLSHWNILIGLCFDKKWTEWTKYDIILCKKEQYFSPCVLILGTKMGLTEPTPLRALLTTFL